MVAALISILAPMPPMIEDNLPTYFFILIFASWVGVRFLAAPYELYKEQLDTRLEIELRSKPKLSVIIADENAKFVMQGATSEAINGSRQTVMRGPSANAISIYCKNTGESDAKNCVVRLMSAEQVLSGSNRRLAIVESVLFSWSNIDPEDNLQRSLAPNEASRIWIAGLTSGGHMW